MNDLLEQIVLTSFEEGYEDYYSGFELIDCPYEFQSDDYFEWLNGWYTACTESEGEIWQL